MSNNHHYFFAVKLPDEVKTFMSEWVQKNKREYPFARWVHPEDYHITLAFLGFAEEQKLQK
ncbi:RNA 2',3'-cyclic phosphodiesterase, partial [Butyricicoccus sp. 1XD8-22]